MERDIDPQRVRSDQQTGARRNRRVRSDATAAQRYQAGEYGEGAAREATGVGPREPRSADQRVDDRPGYPDSYGNVAPGRYGTHGYSGQPAHPSAYSADSGVPGAAEAQGVTDESVQPSAGTTPPSNAQLRELIIERLTEDPQIDARDVTIEVNEGAVRLTGTVGSARVRELIESVIENCGARRLENQLRIAWPGP